MYHVSLELTPEQVKQLKQQALNRDLSVKAYVTRLVTRDLEKAAAAENKNK